MTNPNDITRLKHLDSVLENFSERVPAPAANDADKFLRGDGQWALPTVVVIGTASSTVEGAFWLEE